jgi:KDO2-lipid IV(A) lauroyltransferase
MNVLLGLLGALPRPILSAFGAFLGWLVWILRIRRRVALENLRLAFPEWSDARRLAVVRAHCRHLGQMVPAFLRVPTMSPEELDRVLIFQGWEHYLAAAARGQGVIVCTAHFGNFDLLASACTRRGVPITQIAREMGRNPFNDLWRAARTRSGVEELVVRPGQTVRASIRALQAKRVLAWVIDQNQPIRPIFPTFFGVAAATSATPAFLVRKTGAAVIFALSVPLGDGRHQVTIEEPVTPPDTGDPLADDLAFMQDLNDRLERWVRRHPDRWFWFHRRWKTRPPVGTPAPAPPGPRIDDPDDAR